MIEDKKKELGLDFLTDREIIMLAIKESGEMKSQLKNEFDKNDIRVGTVLECSRVPKADKLLQFKIDDGMGGRTIVSGIAQSYPEPEKLVGMQVCFIANFPPRKLKGVESQGMILSAVNADGKLVLIQPSREVKNGSQVG